MSPFAPQARTTVPLTLTLTSPLHHGAGTSGNTSLLRTHEIVMPDGTHTRVPFVSANSVRHGLRSALAWHTVTTLDIPDGSLSKQVVDLLWSGGAVTSVGAQVDLAAARRVEEVYPALGLLGYAARSDIVEGTLRVSDMELVCRENVWRLPYDLAASPHAARPAAAYRAEEFGTRHDVAGTPVDRYVRAAEDATGQPATTQMIYDLQVLQAGAVLHGQLSLTPAATGAHLRVLAAALALWAPDGVAHLGAKTAVGYGAAEVAGPDPGLTRDALAWWEQHLADHADQVVPLLEEIAG